MIDFEDFDADAAHDFALEAARLQGCTCADEPNVGVYNCAEHGIHLSTDHEANCTIAKLVRHRERAELAHLN
jgi:hypothetical protein